MKTNIAIVDDHPLFLRGLSELLHLNPNYNILHAALGGKQLIDTLRTSRPFPHVCIVDYQMQGMSGLQTLQQIKESWPFIAVIMLTIHDDDVLKQRAAVLGADGYILKDCDADKLFALIDKVAYCARAISN